MKYSLILLLLLKSPSFCMEAPPQSLQQKIVAAQLHNRILCPLARLPKEVQDMIAEYLEFNDKESDEEFMKNSRKITTTAKDYLLETVKKLQRNDRQQYHHPWQADELLLDALNPYETRTGLRGLSSPVVKMIYSRDKSKVLMTKNYSFNSAEKGCYFFIYDMRYHKILFSKFLIDTTVAELNIPLALSNDGKFILQKHQPADGYHYQLFSTERTGIILYTYCVPENFNKQSTKYIYHSPKCMNKEYPEDSQRTASQKVFINLICSEQEHNERSKKTLAWYLHQKGICKPFNYTSIS